MPRGMILDEDHMAALRDLSPEDLPRPGLEANPRIQVEGIPASRPGLEAGQDRGAHVGRFLWRRREIDRPDRAAGIEPRKPWTPAGAAKIDPFDYDHAPLRRKPAQGRVVERRVKTAVG